MATHAYNAGWYADNEGRKYPIDSAATVTDDTGKTFPHGILADAHIVAPGEDATERCYIGGVTITDNLVTLVFTTETRALAALTVQQPIEPFRYYELDPIEEGVTGVVVLGGEARYAKGTWLFSSTDQTGLLPECFSIFPRFPVWSIGIANSGAPYTGDVVFQEGNDTVLRQDGNNIWIGIDVSSNKQEMLKKYIGSCDTRPDSDTCLRTSVTSIGTAKPDCGGHIEIVGDNGISVVETNNVIYLTTNKTLAETCGGSELGEYVGRNNCCEATDFNVVSPQGDYFGRVSVVSGGMELAEGHFTNVESPEPLVGSIDVPERAKEFLVSGSTSGTFVLNKAGISVSNTNGYVKVNNTHLLTAHSTYILITITPSSVIVSEKDGNQSATIPNPRSLDGFWTLTVSGARIQLVDWN